MRRIPVLLSFLLLLILVFLLTLLYLLSPLCRVFTNTPATNCVCRKHSAAAILYLHFALQVMLSHMLNMFCTFMSILRKNVRSAQYGRFL